MSKRGYVRYSGQIDHGPRTCHWSARCVIQGGPADADPLSGNEATARLLEVDSLDLKVEVFSEDLSESLGDYYGAEIPDAEEKYWTRYVERLCVARIERGDKIEETSWEEDQS
jgi:hypothetical protein